MTASYFHLFVCTGTTCEHQDAEEILQHLQTALKQNGLLKKTRVTLARCLGQCGNGPNMVIYPEGIWYGGLEEKGIQRIVKEHLVEGKPVDDLIQIPVD